MPCCCRLSTSISRLRRIGFGKTSVGERIRMPLYFRAQQPAWHHQYQQNLCNRETTLISSGPQMWPAKF